MENGRARHSAGSGGVTIPAYLQIQEKKSSINLKRWDSVVSFTIFLVTIAARKVQAAGLKGDLEPSKVGTTVNIRKK